MISVDREMKDTSLSSVECTTQWEASNHRKSAPSSLWFQDGNTEHLEWEEGDYAKVPGG